MNTMSQTFKDLTDIKTDVIWKQWYSLILESYPSDTSGFLQKEKNRFMNPVGYTLEKESKIILEELIGELDHEILENALNNIIKIRAVQDFCPSDSLSFLFKLKSIFREVFLEELDANELNKDMTILYDRIDQVVLLAFDLYSSCREKIYEVKSLETRKMTQKLLERMNKLDARRLKEE